MKDRPGGPDGLIADTSGNLFSAGPGGVFVFAPDGTLLGIIETGIATSNVAFGEQGQTLFITASDRVFRIPLATRGQGFRP
jgi:gluconolactonase